MMTLQKEGYIRKITMLSVGEPINAYPHKTIARALKSENPDMWATSPRCK